jgi:hypothetical protein
MRESEQLLELCSFWRLRHPNSNLERKAREVILQGIDAAAQAVADNQMRLVSCLPVCSPSGSSSDSSSSRSSPGLAPWRSGPATVLNRLMAATSPTGPAPERNPHASGAVSAECSCRDRAGALVAWQRSAIEAALSTMANQRVRRLPVVTADSKLVGIISMADIVRWAKPLANPAVDAAVIVHAAELGRTASISRIAEGDIGSFSR